MTMRAVGYQSDCLELLDIELPMPQASGHDLLVNVAAVGVNPVDAKVRRRESPLAGTARVLGWDACGIVSSVGESVQGFSVGDRVWYAGALQRPGCNSEWHLVDARLVSCAPRCLSAAEAAALPLTAITAWELLFDRLRLQRSPSAHCGEILLVVGAAGGVGSILVQLASALTGITVVGTASRPESQQWLRDLGVAHVINHQLPFGPQLQALGLSGVGRVISLTHTAQHFEALVDVLEPQGALALIDDPDPSAINVLALKRKSLSLHWELMFTRSLFQTDDMAEQGRILQQVAELVDRGIVRSTLRELISPISARNLEQAHQQLATDHAIGKLVLSGW